MTYVLISGFGQFHLLIQNQGSIIIDWYNKVLYLIHQSVNYINDSQTLIIIIKTQSRSNLVEK